MRILLLFSTAFYLISSVMYIIHLYRNERICEWFGFYTALTGMCLHFIYGIFSYATADRIPILSMPEAISTFGWASVLAFVIFLRKEDEQVLGAFIMPVAFLSEALLLISPASEKPPHTVLTSFLFPVHVTFAFLGYAFFLISFVAGLSYLILEGKMRAKAPGPLLKRLPPLVRVEDLNLRALSYGFPLLTLAIITGAVWSESVRGVWWSWDPKEVWTLAIWILYAVPLHLRVAGWRGKKLAYVSVFAFLILIFAFISSSIFSTYHRF